MSSAPSAFNSRRLTVVLDRRKKSISIIVTHQVCSDVDGDARAGSREPISGAWLPGSQK